jgi:hypothetical protein
MTEEINIFVSIASGAGGGGLLYYLLKTYLIEKIKNQIKFEYEIKFENVRKELEKKATEHQIQYSKLHVDRSEKLKEIYIKLIIAEKSLKVLTSLAQGPSWTKDEIREKDASDKLDELQYLILINRIYFNEDICSKLDNIVIDFNNVITEMRIAKFQSEEYEKNAKEIIKPSALSIWIAQKNKVNNDIIKARDLIAIEFRKILGA